MEQTNYAAKVRAAYAPHEPDKTEELKALDKRVKTPARVIAYVLGAIAALVLGTGMCFAMKVLDGFFIGGIVVGCAGIALCIANYFIYKAILSARKKKYSSRILELTDELLDKRN